MYLRLRGRGYVDALTRILTFPWEFSGVFVDFVLHFRLSFLQRSLKRARDKWCLSQTGWGKALRTSDRKGGVLSKLILASP